MIRHAEEIGRDGIVGTPVPGRQGDSKMLGVSDIYVAASKIFLIFRQRDLSHAGIRLVIHLGATATWLVGVRSSEQRVTVN